MQKQDKALYTQLLTLQESIRGLKTELKKEREQCEEALEDISGNEFEEEVFAEVTEKNLIQNTSEENENASETNEDGFETQEVWKHDRQDSGISVKTPEADSSDILTSSSSKHNSQDLDFLKSLASSSDPKPELISLGKHELSPHVKTGYVEIPQKQTSNAKMIVHHGKQDSGILLDEDAVRDTKLLSKLVESSPEMFEKMENRKIDRIIHDKWMRVRDNSLGNVDSQYQHKRSWSSSDLLLKNQSRNGLQHQYSTSRLLSNHSHTNLCPQRTSTPFTEKGKDFNHPTYTSTQEKEYRDLEKALFNDSYLKILPVHARSSSCPQTLIDPRTDARSKQPIKQLKIPVRPSIEIERFKSDEKQNSGKDNRKLLILNESVSTSKALNTSGSGSSKSFFNQAFVPKHHHSNSLPLTPESGLSLAGNLLSTQRNRRSMESISDLKVVPAQQVVRPRKRSASYVDLGGLGGLDNNLCGSSQDKKNTGTVASQTGSSKQANEGNHGGKSSSEDGVTAPQKASVKQTDNLKQALLNCSAGSSFNRRRADSLPQTTTNKAKVVHINNSKSFPNQVNENKVNTVRTVTILASEVSISNTADKQTLSRKYNPGEKEMRNRRTNVGPQRRSTITNIDTERALRQQPGNGKISQRFLASSNHLRHHTAPEYDVTYRRHSMHTFHAPSKSWDGYTRKRPEVTKGIVRSASQVSLV